MFRLQDNTPSVYTEQSRDFQLFCRLYDCINNGVQFDIKTMINILDPMKINDRMLSLLCTKVGFFPKKEYDSNILRHIISTFPYAVKYKGTELGIKMAVSTILKAEGDFSDSDEDFSSTVNINNFNHTIAIYTKIPIFNKHALRDFLSYIMPVGYTYTIGTHRYEKRSQKIYSKDIVNYMVLPSVSNSQVRGSDRYSYKIKNGSFQFISYLQERYIGTFNSTEIIGSENYLTAGSYATDISGNIRDTIDENSRVAIDTTQNKGE